MHVVVGILFNSKRDVFIARRLPNQPLGGYWEFPGGKVEPGESPEEALIRELKEELGITVLTSKPFMKTQHRYTKHEVLLDVWLIENYRDKPIGNEGQETVWVSPSELSRYQFPEANQVIIQRLVPRDDVGGAEWAL